HLDISARRRHGRNADLVDRFDERRGAAVHDRDFGAVDLDHHVIDAKAVQSSEHMFGGRYRRTALIAEHGREFGRRHGAEIGGKFAISLAVAAATPEHHTGICLGRMQRYRDWRTGVNTDAGNSNLLAQGGLRASLHAPRHALVLHLTAGLPRQSSQPQMRDATVCTKEPFRQTPEYPNTNPLRRAQTIPATWFRANSLFLTDCYLFPAALLSARCRLW